MGQFPSANVFYGVQLPGSMPSQINGWLDEGADIEQSIARFILYGMNIPAGDDAYGYVSVLATKANLAVVTIGGRHRFLVVYSTHEHSRDWGWSTFDEGVLTNADRRRLADAATALGVPIGTKMRWHLTSWFD